MAIMHPKALPDYIRKNPLRTAECKVYDEFSQQLDDTFHVFYSSPWLGTTDTGAEKDGEADFTVAHIEHGILTVEVKGGRVRVESDTRQWFSKNRDGLEFKIKNPVQQAREAKHNLLKSLKNRPEWTSRYINARHGVILTDTKTPAHELGPDMPLKIFAFAEHMAHLQEWVRDRFSCREGGQHPENFQPLGIPGTKALEAMLAGGIRLAVDLRTYLEDDINTINLLTDDQYSLLMELKENRRMAISGAAGTGKTVLAAHKATVMQQSGVRTLLVCFNEPLATDLRAKLAELKGLDVWNYHKLCRTFAEEAKLEMPEFDSSRLFFEKILPDLFVSALSVLPERRYGAVIVDEGQDFSDLWLESLELVLSGEESDNLYIFYDDNQKVMNRGATFIDKMPSAKRRLSRNVRNTRTIFDLSKRFYSGTGVVAVGPDGEAIQWMESSSDAEATTILKQKLGSLITDVGLQPNRIAVLCPDAITSTELSPANQLGRYRTAGAANASVDAVTVDSVRRFKGLESDVVIMFMPDAYIDDIEALYVATTRARVLLIVIGSPQALAVLREHRDIQNQAISHQLQTNTELAGA